MHAGPGRSDATPHFLGGAAALAFLAGALAVHALPSLPPRWLEALLALGGLLLAWPSRTRLAGIVLLGFACCAWRAGLAFEARLPRALEGRDFTLSGQVSGLPRQGIDATAFEFRVEHAELGGEAIPLSGTLRLSWYDAVPVELAACTRWRLVARLKRPRGFVNPGGHDSERRALERGIVAVGYVREVERAEFLGRRTACVDGLRERLSAGIAARAREGPSTTLLQTLAVGDTRGLAQEDWATARANGVSHLLAISGFHIGVAALLGAWLVRLLWWLAPGLGLRLPRVVAESLAALALAVAYGLLAGASLPTLRALAMIAVACLVRASRRAGSAGQGLALALIAILVADPLATLAPGFWLSFGGVALLLSCLDGPGRGWRGFLRALGGAQLLMAVTLLPLTVWFFGEAAPLGALSNLLAVPLVSFVLVPLALLGLAALLLVPPLAGPLLGLAGWVAQGLWRFLEWMAAWPGAHWYFPEVAPWALALAMLGAVWLFLPRGLPLRWLGLALLLPLLAPARELPAQGAFEAEVLDVGQGLAVIVRTARHALLYDAGARYPSGFDLGEAVVLPALRARGIGGLEVAIASHGDNDHAGGMAAVLAAEPQARVLAGEPGRLPFAARQCEAGETWDWDGVRMRVLHPPASDAGMAAPSGNDRSCVLLVEGGGGRLLLAGDISRRVEPTVAAALGPGPPLVLVVPHHGSRSSSGEDFLESVHPVFGVVSAGWRNRFGHPHPQVLARYASLGIPLAGTAEAGALRLAFPATTAPRLASSERHRRRRHWRE